MQRSYKKFVGDGMKFLIVENPRLKGAQKVGQEISKFLEECGGHTIEHVHFGADQRQWRRRKGDVAITIGGDGTVLRTAQLVDAKILAVNAGEVGFLTEVSTEEILDRLQDVLAGNYSIDKRIRLKVEYGGERPYDCLNEAVLNTSHISKMREFEILLNGQSVSRVRADGIIIATPTGSTCYAMSAGGPILDPNVDAFVVQPLAPFKLSARSLVVPAEGRITLRLTRRKPCLLVLDGQYEVKVEGGEVHFSKSEKDVEFIRFKYDFYRRIEQRLSM